MQILCYHQHGMSVNILIEATYYFRIWYKTFSTNYHSTMQWHHHCYQFLTWHLDHATSVSVWFMSY